MTAPEKLFRRAEEQREYEATRQRVHSDDPRIERWWCEHLDVGESRTSCESCPNKWRVFYRKIDVDRGLRDKFEHELKSTADRCTHEVTL